MTSRKKEEAVPSNRTRSDLSWFFCEAESAMGVRSNLGAMLSRIELGLSDTGGTIQVDSMAWSRLEAAERYGRIISILRVAGTESGAILEAIYTARQFPVALREFFGDTTPVVLRLPMTKRLYKQADTESSLADWLCRLVVMGSKVEKDSLKTLRIKAEDVILKAYKSYEKAARLMPRDDD